jgi:1-acyl-sn-glycerol-3-phosphate acyltransferase
MALPPRPVRWLVLAPITWMGSVACIVLGIALLPVALLIDVVDRRSWRATRLLRLGWTFCVLEALALPAAFWVWMTGPFRSGDAQVDRYQALLGWWLRSITGAIRSSLGFEFEVRFPDTGAAPLIVLSRHAGPGDALFLMDLLANGQGRRIRSLGKERLLWDPFFDHVATGAGYVFLRPGDGVETVRAYAAMPARGAFISFPEGGNFTRKRHDRAVELFRSRGDADLAEMAASLDHLLLPRSGAVHAALEGAPASTVVFVGHAGYEGLDSLAGLWEAIPEGRRIILEARVVERPAGWHDREVVAPWLLSCWVDMDRWIDRHDPRDGGTTGGG